MQLRLAQFILFLTLTLSFAAPSLGNLFHTCDPSSNSAGSSDSHPQDGLQHTGHLFSSPAKSEKSPSPGEDCPCPVHHSGCHHSIAYSKNESRSALSADQSFKELSATHPVIISAPFLEGPFQPPRA